MAKQRKAEALAVDTANMEVLNKGDIEAFEALDTRIGVACRNVESNMLNIFGALAVISEKNLHRVNGYKNAREYILDRHGMTISKGQLSDAVNTFKKFGDMETGYLKDAWLPYTFSQLKLMRKLTDEELAEVTPAVSCRQLQDIINATKALEEKPEVESQSSESESSDNVSRETKAKVTREETSGNVEPYIEMTYSMAEFAELDAEFIKSVIMEAFKSGNNVRLNYTID